MLDGDNQYLCEKCGEKKDTLKRVCLKASSLPKTLIFHLKRFEFDMDTLQRMKVNNRCEFPHNLDMRPYTNDDESQKLPDSHFMYELVGIVVHAGSSESGHYYSFIRERNTNHWIQFNDSNVTSFDADNIEDQCFGGFDNNNNNKGTMYHQAFEKPYNAYLLIYDRKSSTSLSQTDVNAFTLYPKVLSSIMRFNTSLLHDKQIFSDEYRDLMLKLCELDPCESTCKLITTFVFEVLLYSKNRSYTKKFLRYLERT
jgi:ubiquitin carboxyl-terminal hydrolase 34